MKPIIPPIETYYNGYKFRSRLEAKWAVFFDHAKIKYEYETEGYVNDEDCYLPDFYLPEFDVHCEVKSDRNGVAEEFKKILSNIYWGGAIKAVVFLGDIPPIYNGNMWYFPMVHYSCGYAVKGDKQSAWWMFRDKNNRCIGYKAGWLENCAPIKKINGKFTGRKMNDFALKDEPFSLRAASGNELGETKYFGNYLECLNTNPILFSALDKARQARFEHGEKG